MFDFGNCILRYLIGTHLQLMFWTLLLHNSKFNMCVPKNTDIKPYLKESSPVN